MTDSHSKATRTRRARKQFVLFMLVGGVAALVNVLSRVVLNAVTTYDMSIALAFVCGMTTAYLLNRLFVFDPSQRKIHDEYLRFALVNLAALAQVYLVSVVTARVIFPRIAFSWHPETVAHVIGVIIPAFTSYFAHKSFSFSKVKSST